MDVGLNVWPGLQGIGRPLVRRLFEMGFAGFRIGLAHDPAITEPVLEELAEFSGARHVWLIAGGQMTKGFPSTKEHDPWTADELVKHARAHATLLAHYGFTEPIIEVGNEPDLAHEYWAEQPILLGHTFRRVVDAIREVLPRALVLCPSISNLDQDSIAYLRGMCPLEGFPPGTGCAVHRYPYRTDAVDAHPGFQNRYQEIEAVRQIVGKDTPIYVTECGIHEGPHVTKKLFGLCKKKRWLSEDEVAKVITDDLKFFTRAGVAGAYIYQLNSGPDRNEREHSYGLRRHDEPWDGEWKRIAHALPNVIKEVA